MWLRVPFTKEELGRALGRTSVAVAAITDIGLAAAVARRLAELDPARYGESAARLGIAFLDAQGIAEFNAVDGMHLTARGHRQLAEKLAEVIPGLV